MAKNFTLFSIFCLFFFVFDRLVKWLVLHSLPQEGIFIIPKILQIKLSQNPGLAFNLPLGEFLVYILIISIWVFLVGWFVKTLRKKDWLQGRVIFLIIVGAFSNLLDRILYGWVIDYFDFTFWPTFNLADLMVVGGVIAILILGLKNSRCKVQKL